MIPPLKSLFTADELRVLLTEFDKETKEFNAKPDNSPDHCKECPSCQLADMMESDEALGRLLLRMNRSLFFLLISDQGVTEGIHQLMANCFVIGARAAKAHIENQELERTCKIK